MQDEAAHQQVFDLYLLDKCLAALAPEIEVSDKKTKDIYHSFWGSCCDSICLLFFKYIYAFVDDTLANGLSEVPGWVDEHHDSPIF